MLKKLICFNSIKMHPFQPSSLALQINSSLSLSLISLNMANLVTSFMLWLCLISYAYTTIHAAPEWPRGRSTRFYDFKIQTMTVNKLCNSKQIVTVNNMFPGPVVYAQQGDRLIVKDIVQLERQVVASGGGPPPANAYTINGHPGPNYNCSANGN
ncbi:hypothetical protein NC652_033043 [Populus alba x Populus x berolinensis]|nr:hypothetical protein NC652_033043 [Populus alba x Populus x berolinensis]